MRTLYYLLLFNNGTYMSSMQMRNYFVHTCVIQHLYDHPIVFSLGIVTYRIIYTAFNQYIHTCLIIWQKIKNYKQVNFANNIFSENVVFPICFDQFIPTNPSYDTSSKIIIGANSSRYSICRENIVGNKRKIPCQKLFSPNPVYMKQ